MLDGDSGGIADARGGRSPAAVAGRFIAQQINVAIQSLDETQASAVPYDAAFIGAELLDQYQEALNRISETLIVPQRQYLQEQVVAIRAQYENQRAIGVDPHLAAIGFLRTLRDVITTVFAMEDGLDQLAQPQQAHLFMLVHQAATAADSSLSNDGNGR